MPDYDALRNKQSEFIRKALDGSVFIAPLTAELPGASATTPFDLTTATGTGANKVISLAELPEGWDDLGWLTEDGAQFSREVSQSEVTSWGSVSPTRTDVTTDTSTLTFSAQETKLVTIGVATGADLSAARADANTGAVVIKKPTRAVSRAYRALSLAVDNNEFGEIYIGRLLPRGKVTSYAEQSFGGGDDPVLWGATLTGEEDSDVGFSEAWFFGGAGWDAIVEDMGFTRAA